MQAPRSYNKTHLTIALNGENPEIFLMSMLEEQPDLREVALFMTLNRGQTNLTKAILSQYPKTAVACDNGDVQDGIWNSYGYYAIEWAASKKNWERVKHFIQVLWENPSWMFEKRQVPYNHKFQHSLDSSQSDTVTPAQYVLIEAVNDNQTDLVKLLIKAKVPHLGKYYTTGALAPTLLQSATNTQNKELVAWLLLYGYESEPFFGNQCFEGGWILSHALYADDKEGLFGERHYNETDLKLAIKLDLPDILFIILEANPSFRKQALFITLGENKTDMAKAILSRYPQTAFAYDDKNFQVKIADNGCTSHKYYAIECAAVLKNWDCVQHFARTIIENPNPKLGFIKPVINHGKKHFLSYDSEQSEPLFPLQFVLARAVEVNQTDVVRLILKAGANPDFLYYTNGKQGPSLLKIATYFINVPMAGNLLLYGANSDQPTLQNDPTFIKAFEWSFKQQKNHSNILALVTMLKATLGKNNRFSNVSHTIIFEIFKRLPFCMEEKGQNADKKLLAMQKSVVEKMQGIHESVYLDYAKNLLLHYDQPQYKNLVPLMDTLSVILDQLMTTSEKCNMIAQNVSYFLQELPLENLEDSSNELMLLKCHHLRTPDHDRLILQRKFWVVDLFDMTKVLLSKDTKEAKDWEPVYSKILKRMENVCLKSTLVVQIQILLNVEKGNPLEVSRFLSALIINEGLTLAGVFWDKWQKNMEKDVIYFLIKSIPMKEHRATCLIQALGWDSTKMPEDNMITNIYMACHTKRGLFGTGMVERMEGDLIALKPEFKPLKGVKYAPPVRAARSLREETTILDFEFSGEETVACLNDLGAVKF